MLGPEVRRRAAHAPDLPGAREHGWDGVEDIGACMGMADVHGSRITFYDGTSRAYQSASARSAHIMGSLDSLVALGSVAGQVHSAVATMTDPL